MLHALLLASLLAGPGGPGAPQKYKIEVKNTMVMDLSSMGQGVQNTGTSAVGWLAVTMTDSAKGKVFRVVIDSSTFDGGEMMAMLPDSLKTTKPGTTFSVYVVDGKVADMQAPENGSLGALQLLGGVTALYMQPKAGTAVGGSWVDTAKVDTTVAGARQTGTTITTWHYTAKDGTISTLDATSTGNLAMSLMGQEVQATNTGKHHVVAEEGKTVRESNTETKTEMALAMGGQTVQMSMVSTVTVKQLP